jgi:predicted nucleic acid-binding protein
MDKGNTAQQVVVCDAGPIIHLDEVDCLDLLAEFAEVLIPDAVWIEIQRHRPTSLISPTAKFLRVIPNTPLTEELQTLSRLFALHAGELQALQVATEFRADLLLTDDTAARLAAKNMAIPVHGTIGILLRSIRRNQRTASDVANVLRSLSTTSTLHIRQALLDEILKNLST